MLAETIKTSNKVQHHSLYNKGVELNVSTFEDVETTEIHLMAAPKTSRSFPEQLNDTIEAIENFIVNNNVSNNGLIVLRFFVSDCANQLPELNKVSQSLEEKHNGVAISIVQQPPLNNSKVVAWAYLVSTSKTITKQRNGEYINVKLGGYQHIYHTQLIAKESIKEDSFKQTNEIFKSFNQNLEHEGLNMKDHCIRTWIYVKDVDYNYNGVVVARREYFKELGLTNKTHYITSTGIEGRHFNYNTSVLMDAYSIKGIEEKQVTFLHALDYLNPTHEYGVTFERGTAVDFGDRRHIYLSGTASIDNKGEVVHPQKIDLQIKRTLTNVEALLNDADADLQDIAQLIIYLRDMGDAQIVNDYFDKNLINIPKVIVLAPVCRPGWLIEMECIAIKAIDNNSFPNF